MRIINDNKFLGYEGESYFRTISFEIDESFNSYDVYLEFHVLSTNKYYRSKKLDITKDYLIPYELLKKKGHIKAQLIALKGKDVVGKSDPETFIVKESINATDIIIETEGYNNLKEILKEELKEELKEYIDRFYYVIDNKLVISRGYVTDNKLIL